MLWGDGFNQKPLVVQLLRVINVGVPQNSGGVAENNEDGSDNNSENEDEME